MLFALILCIVIVYIVVKKITSFRNDVRIYSEILEDNARMERCQITPERQTFLFSQSSAINNFIKDRNLGTNYDWACFEEGLLNVYRPNQGKKLYYVTLFCNSQNKAEIELFNALDGSFRYDARENNTDLAEDSTGAYFSSDTLK